MSAEPSVITVRPSGDRTTNPIPYRCSGVGLISLPVAASHMRTMEISPPAKILLSGEKLRRVRLAGVQQPRLAHAFDERDHQPERLFLDLTPWCRRGNPCGRRRTAGDGT